VASDPIVGPCVYKRQRPEHRQPMSGALVGYVFSAAVRDRLMIVLLAALVLGASLSLFLGGSALIEKTQFSRVFAAGGLRMTGLACLVLFVISHIRRSFETRDVDYLLSRPVGRVSFILSHAAAFSLLAVLVALGVCVAVWSAAPTAPDRVLALWFVSLTAEYVMMADAALFFAMVLPGVASGTMASLGLYVLARLMGQLLGIAASDLSFPGSGALTILLNVISVVIPRLDLMAQSSWLVYGLDPTVGFGFVLLQAAVFSFLVVCAAAVDLVRRQF
jgi:hypothetical protein